MEYIWKQKMYIKRLPFFCSSMETFRISDFEDLLKSSLPLSLFLSLIHPPSQMMVFHINNTFFLVDIRGRGQKNNDFQIPCPVLLYSVHGVPQERSAFQSKPDGLKAPNPPVRACVRPESTPPSPAVRATPPALRLSNASSTL